MLKETGRQDAEIKHASRDDRDQPTAPHDWMAGVRKPALIILHQEHSNPGQVGQWFTRNGFALDIRRPRFGDPLPTTMAEHCGAVIFGGPMSANDTDDYVKVETDWIGVTLKEQAPFLGICLGAQMLARHLGSRVYLDPAAEVEIGYFPITPTEAGQAFGPWPDKFYEWHKEGFDVPSGGALLATGGGVFPNQAFQYGAAALAVQFHPEITCAQVHRWSGHNVEKLLQKGAQPQHTQLDGHRHYVRQVHAWLDAVMRRWVRVERRTP